MKQMFDIKCSEHNYIDIFVPDSLNGGAVFFIHGGGWSGGNKEQWHGVMELFCEKGYVCASVSYRLSGTAKYPAQIEDVEAGMAYFKEQADIIGFDKDKIVVFGSSAGGYLCLVLGQNENPDLRPAGMVLYCPVSTLLYNKEGDSWPFARNFLGVHEKDRKELYISASPYHHITGDEPPMVFIHGDMDNTVPIQNSFDFSEKANSMGALSTVVVVEGAGHGFGYGTDTPERKKAIEAAAGFIANTIG